MWRPLIFDIIPVYTVISVLALMLILPMAPFAINAHRSLTFIILAIFISSTLYTWFSFPFTPQDPVHIYFAQTVDLHPSSSDIERITTTLAGPKQYLQSHIIPLLPSAYNASIQCDDTPDFNRLGLQTCKWEAGNEMAPSPGGNQRDQGAWINASIVRIGDTRARVVLRGQNTRNCNIELGNRRIIQVAVAGDGGKGLQAGYEIPDDGSDTLLLWGRDFGKEFEVDLAWKGDASPAENVTGYVSCNWAEYESGTVGGGGTGGKIPSLEEVIQFLPEWAVVVEAGAALFEARTYFEI